MVISAGMGQATMDASSASMNKGYQLWSVDLEEYAAALSSVSCGMAASWAPVQAVLPPAVQAMLRGVSMEAGPQSSAARPVTAMGSELAALTEEKRQPHMEAVVMRVVREVTGDENVGSGTPLMEAGVDSLAATELANRLRATT